MIFAKDIPSAVSQVECERLAALAANKIVLEIGAEYGRSTIAMASTAAVVFSVDWHLGDRQSGYKDSLPEFVRNLTAHGVRERVVTIVGRWNVVAHAISPLTFDLVFHDACHDGQAVHEDLDLALIRLRPAGMIAVHDCDQPATAAAVLGFAAERHLEIGRLRIGTLLELTRQSDLQVLL